MGSLPAPMFSQRQDLQFPALAAVGCAKALASSAIPIFFPSVQIDGRYFGDGCIRNTTPLSPAINLGADRIVAIGVQGQSTHPSRVAGKNCSRPRLPKSPVCCWTQ